MLLCLVFLCLNLLALFDKLYPWKKKWQIRGSETRRQKNNNNNKIKFQTKTQKSPPKKRLRDPSKTAQSRFRDGAEIVPRSTFFEEPFYTLLASQKPTRVSVICMWCTRENKEHFHLRFVQILIIFRAFSLVTIWLHILILYDSAGA